MIITEQINNYSDNPKLRKILLLLSILVFFVIILIPSVFVLTQIFPYYDEIVSAANSSDRDVMLGAIGNSFSIALIVTLIDIVVGLPIAWILVRKDFAGKRLLDTFLDIPLAFPTAVLGLSVIMFWSAPDGITVPSVGLHIDTFGMMILLHLLFTYPYMVRSLQGILEQINPTYETAAATLGASKWIAVRTITLPLFRAGLVVGFVLCFARSISETGGTMIALNLLGVDSTFFTGPTYIAYNDGQMGIEILTSVLMIVFSLLLLVVATFTINHFHIKIEKVYPSIGKTLSTGLFPKLKDSISIIFLIVFILIPAFYLFAYLGHFNISDGAGLLSQIGLSFIIAGVAVIFDVIFGIPLQIYIARHRNTKNSNILDSLLNIPLLVPTTVLGFSLSLFWAGGHQTTGALAIVLVILAHTSFTYPMVVKNLIGAIEEVDPQYEETAMTLGAKPFETFRTILFPAIKSQVIAGQVLAFTRSIGETGATIQVSEDVRTIPCYIVDLIETNDPQMYAEAASCSIVFVILCFFILFGIRVLINGRKRR